MNFRAQIDALGVLFEVEVDYEFSLPEDDTGWPGDLEITEVWVLGYYPEYDGKRGEYVPLNVKSRLDCLNNPEYKHLEQLAERNLNQQRKEAYEARL